MLCRTRIQSSVECLPRYRCDFLCSSSAASGVAESIGPSSVLFLVTQAVSYGTFVRLWCFSVSNILGRYHNSSEKSGRVNLIHQAVWPCNTFGVVVHSLFLMDNICFYYSVRVLHL